MPLRQAFGPGTAMILLFISPVIYSVPIAFSTADLSTADPDGGRYYRWGHACLR